MIQRIGREAVLEQAIRDSLPEWYERAMLDAGLPTVGDPKLDVDQLPAEGEELVFSIEIGGAADGEAGRVRGLEVGRTEVEVPEDADRRASSTACARASEPEPRRARGRRGRRRA